MRKTHWNPDDKHPTTACGKYPHMVSWVRGTTGVSCKVCQAAIERHLDQVNEKMNEQDEPQKFVRAGTSVCMRGEGDDKLIYVLFDAHPQWFEEGQDTGNKFLFERYAEDIVEMLNENWN